MCQGLAVDKTAGRPTGATEGVATPLEKARSVLWHMWITVTILFYFYHCTWYAVKVYRKVGSWGAATLDEKHTMSGAPFSFFAAIFLLLCQYGFVKWEKF